MVMYSMDVDVGAHIRARARTTRTDRGLFLETGTFYLYLSYTHKLFCAFSSMVLQNSFLDHLSGGPTTPHPPNLIAGPVPVVVKSLAPEITLFSYAWVATSDLYLRGPDAVPPSHS